LSLTINEKWLRGSLVAIVIIHFIVALWHGVTHLEAPVPLTDPQAAFVFIVILLLPFIGVGFLWSKWKRAAVWLIALCMLASLLFGFINHFMLSGTDDYVLNVPAHMGQYWFVFTAALLVGVETIGTMIPFMVLRVTRHYHQKHGNAA
jgi:hypothetical protein